MFATLSLAATEIPTTFVVLKVLVFVAFCAYCGSIHIRSARNRRSK